MVTYVYFYKILSYELQIINWSSADFDAEEVFNEECPFISKPIIIKNLIGKIQV